MLLDLQLTVVGPPLYVTSYKFGDLGKDDERLGQLLGFDQRDAREVGLVESECKQRVNFGVQMRILELVVDDELLAKSLGCLLGDLVVAELESNFSEVAGQLVQ